MKLSTSEKFQLVSELCEELESQTESFPVPKEYIAELDRRMEEFKQHPDRYSTWEEVKARILGSRA